jgi:hypothetical protein
VLELVDEQVAQGSTQQIDTAVLPMVVAEMAIIRLEKHWPYKEGMTEKSFKCGKMPAK